MWSQVRYYRNFALAMDMVVASDPVVKAARRVIVQNNFLMPTEYAVMLYGNAAAPQPVSQHFSLVTKGATTTGTAGVGILYSTHECLRSNASTCLAKNHTLYQYVSNGLDRAIQAYINEVHAVVAMNGSYPTIDGPDFALIWNTKPDIAGGLEQMNAIYYQFVLSVYQQVLTIQIIGLVFALLLMIVFYFFMLRPYINELTKCRRRIAYLLSSLPNEVDILTLVKKAVANTTGGRKNGSESLRAQSSASSNNSMSSLGDSFNESANFGG